MEQMGWSRRTSLSGRDLCAASAQASLDYSLPYAGQLARITAAQRTRDGIMSLKVSPSVITSLPLAPPYLD